MTDLIAIRKLAPEAADNGLIAPELAAGSAGSGAPNRKASASGTGCQFSGRKPRQTSRGSSDPSQLDCIVKSMRQILLRATATIDASIG